MTKLSKTTDDDGVIKDGQTVRVPMNMMDGVRDPVQRAIMADSIARQSGTLHAPGSLPLTDADRTSRETLYQRRDQKTCDAWRTAPSLDPGQTVQTITLAASADVYQRRDAKLRDAWK